jgi:integrase
MEPNLAPRSYDPYEGLSRRNIGPGLGRKRLDRLSVQDVQTWLNQVRRNCQCCFQGLDARRPVGKQRCRAIGTCCGRVASAGTIVHLRRVLRVILAQAIIDGIISRNVASPVKLPTIRKRRRATWSSDEARRFLEPARHDGDPFYAAYVLVLVLGLRKGELLGPAREDVDFDAGEVPLAWQLQRVGDTLVRRETRTRHFGVHSPLPDICVAALASHRDNTKDQLVVVLA